MADQNLSDQAKFATTPQNEAVQNIQGAQFFDINPEHFKADKVTLLPQMKAETEVPLASPLLAKEISRSPEHASAYMPDIANYKYVEDSFTEMARKRVARSPAARTEDSWFGGLVDRIGSAMELNAQTERAATEATGRYAQYTKQRVQNRLGPEQRLNELNWLKMQAETAPAALGYKFGENEDMELTALRAEAETGFGTKQFGFDSALESLPADVIAAGVDLPAMLYRNKAVSAGILATYAGYGAVTGSMAGGVGAVPGAAAGLIPGSIAAFTATSFMDSYKNTAAQTYGYLDLAIGDDGKPLNIDRGTKAALAHGVGMINGALAAAVDPAIAKNFPFVRNMTGKQTAQWISKLAQNDPMRIAILNVGRAAMLNGGQAGFQGLTQTVAEQVGKTYKDGQLAVANGLLNAVKDPETYSRLGREALVGAASGTALTAAMEGAGRGLTAGAKKVRDDLRSNRQGPNEPPALGGVRDVGPDVPPAPALTDLANPSDHMNSIIDVLDLQDTLDATREVSTRTKLHGLSPAESLELRKKVMQGADTKYVWFDRDDLNKFANTPEKAEAVGKAFDLDDAVRNSRDNTPVRVDLLELLPLHDKFPDISEFARLNPEGPSPNLARTYLEKRQEVEKQRSEIRTQLGLRTEKTAADRAQEAALRPDSTDDEITAALTTQEDVDAYLERLTLNEKEQTADPAAIQTMRKRVTALRETLPNELTHQEKLKGSLEFDPTVSDVFGEADFRSVPDWTRPEMEKVVPEGLREKWLALETESRDRISEHITDSAIYEQDKLIDLQEKLEMDVQLEMEAERLLSDPNIALVERFKAVPSELPAHGKKTFGAFAIDPSLLSPEQKNKYRDDLALKKHKVFVKGGIHPESAAQLLGVQDGNTLLDILSKTPDRQDAVRQAAELRRGEIRDAIVDDVPLHDTALAKAYSNKVRNNLQIARDIFDNNNSTYRQAAMKMASPPPRLEAVQAEARKLVRASKVADLNVNQFVVGERKSNRNALDSILRGDSLKAVDAKVKAAENAAKANETRQAIGLSNRTIQFARRMMKKDSVAVFKEAGGATLEAYEFLMGAYGFDISKRDTAKRESYLKWVQEQIEDGRGNFEIPEAFLNPRTSPYEMTVEELDVVGQRLRTLWKTAKEKDRLLTKFGDEAKQLQTIDAVANQLAEHLVAQGDLDFDRNIQVQTESRSWFDKRSESIANAAAGLMGVDFLLQKLDGDKIGGPFQQFFAAKLRGLGDQKGGGLEYEQALNKQLMVREEELINQFGKKEYQNLKATDVYIEEWKDSKVLNYGKVNKWDLFMILMNMGEDGNAQAFVKGVTSSRFTTDVESVLKVLDRYIPEEKYDKLAQGFWDMFKAIEPKVSAMHEDMSGNKMGVLPGRPFERNGRVVNGGYFPRIYAPVKSAKKIAKAAREQQDAMSGEKRLGLTPERFATEDMTWHAYTEQRKGITGDQIHLGISPGALLGAMTRDLAFRPVLHDVMRVVTHQDLREHIVAKIGLPNYNVLVNTFSDLGTSQVLKDAALFDSYGAVRAIKSVFKSSITGAYLLYRLPTLGVQFTSLGHAVNKLGDGGAKSIALAGGKLAAKASVEKMRSLSKHLGIVSKEIENNPVTFNDYVKFAAEIHPPIRDFMNGQEDNYGLAQVMGDNIPKRYPLHRFTKWYYDKTKGASDLGFQALGHADNAQKVIVTIAAYRQFMAGEAPGHSLEAVRNMTPEERKQKATVYASESVVTALTSGDRMSKAAMQKDPRMEDFMWFYNDRRNQLGNMMQQGRRIRKATEDAASGFQEEGVKSSRGWKGAGKAAKVAAIFMIVNATIRGMEDWIRGKDGTPWSEETEDSENASWAWYIASSPVVNFMNTIPLVSDVAYYLDTVNDFNRGTKVVAPPITRAYTDVAVTADVLMNIMDYYNEDRELTTQQKRSLALTTSYLTNTPLPVNALLKGLDYLEEGGLEDTLRLNQSRADRFVQMFRKTETLNAAAPESEKLPEDIMKALKEAEAAFGATSSEKTSAIMDLPKDIYEQLKQIASGGNKFAVNAKNGAAGIYQFTAQQWNRMRDENPELELTENGRTSAKIDQQERAMKHRTEENVRMLAAGGAEITSENIYMAHLLEPETALEVINAKGTVELQTLVGKAIMDANEFAKDLKVRDFKTWIKTKVKQVKVAGVE